jgi:hypothetical protein
VQNTLFKNKITDKIWRRDNGAIGWQTQTPPGSPGGDRLL